MKRKHHGLLSVILVMSAMGTMALYALHRTGRVQPVIASRIAKAPPEVFVPGPQEMKKTRALNRRMADFQLPHPTDQVPVNLALFGYDSAEAKQRLRDGVQRAGLDKAPYLLTFTFSSSRRQFCIIDGMFYQAGSLLPDGSRIARIRSKQVLVTKEGVKRWIPLTPSGISGQRRAGGNDTKGMHQESR